LASVKCAEIKLKFGKGNYFRKCNTELFESSIKYMPPKNKQNKQVTLSQIIIRYSSTTIYSDGRNFKWIFLALTGTPGATSCSAFYRVLKCESFNYAGKYNTCKTICFGRVSGYCAYEL
jgi:hypothetical protein